MLYYTVCYLLGSWHYYFISRGVNPETKGTAFVVYEDIFDAKNACDHLSGFNVCNRYLVVLYYQSTKVSVCFQSKSSGEGRRGNFWVKSYGNIRLGLRVIKLSYIFKCCQKLLINSVICTTVLLGLTFLPSVNCTPLALQPTTVLRLRWSVAGTCHHCSG